MSLRKQPCYRIRMSGHVALYDLIFEGRATNFFKFFVTLFRFQDMDPIVSWSKKVRRQKACTLSSQENVSLSNFLNGVICQPNIVKKKNNFFKQMDSYIFQNLIRVPVRETMTWSWFVSHSTVFFCSSYLFMMYFSCLSYLFKF